jgi:hypothetical protein
VTLQQTAPRLKACRVCRDAFQPARPLQVVCGLVCAKRLPVLARKQARAERKATRERLEELQPLRYWINQAQEAFNAWIRERDVGEPCVSCGRFHKGKWNAGHYLSTGARPELRFDEDNVNKQCEPCNTNKAGNAILYRIELVRRRGLAVVERLEGPHPAAKFTREQLHAIRDDYRARLRALQKGRDA